ncbi:MAG: two-component regulator propeller domain-containing protein [Bacteroidota bacterium]
MINQYFSIATMKSNYQIKAHPIFLSVLLVLISLQHVAQQYNFKNYSVENGLPYVQIFAMYQDSKGYLWSGGYGGASKFNGKTFQNYSPKNGLANHYVNAIIEDQFHLITVGTIDGLSVIDKVKGQINNYYIKDGLPSNNVTSFCLDPNKGLWTGTNKGLCIWDGKKVIQVPFFKNYNITCLLYSEKLGIIIGTNRGLFLQDLNSNAFKVIAADIAITCVSENKSNNTLYAGTTNGLYILDLEKKVSNIFHVSNGLIDEEITSVLCQGNEAVWIGSKTGLISFNGKDFSYFTIGFDNNSNHIRSLLVDYENNLWIGTHSGLYKYRGKGFTVYDRQNGLGSAFIYQITRDKNQNLWFGTEANGVYKFSNGFFKNYSTKQGLLDNKVSAILPFDDGSVWFGTDKGISLYKNEKITNLFPKAIFKQEVPINCFYRDSKNTIWVGGQNGLSSIKKNSSGYVITYHKLPVKLVEKEGYAVWSIIEDSQGFIWAGTYLAGIYKLEGSEFKQQSITSPEPVTTALDLSKDQYGNIYAATLNGVLMFNPDKHSYKIISEKEGLSSELVYAISMTHDHHYLWAGTNQGINRIDIKKLQYDYIDILKYNKNDGFSGVESNSHGIYEDADSSIWFGTVNGLIKYSPKEFIENDNLSKTNIANIKIGYMDTLLANGSVLPYSMNNISFYFDGICLTAPEKVLYSYKLDNYDKEWSPSTDINYTKYDNLPPGKYVFKVKSCNNEGIWNIEAVEFVFIIRAPFYKTWWFILGCILCGVGLVISIFRLRLMQIKRKQQMEFEQLVEVSKAELKALRAQMNPHFVFNSLNSIQHYILNSKGDEAAKYLNKFAKLIRIILNNSEKPTVTINEEIEGLELYLELERMRFENKFDYSFEVDKSIDGDYDEIPPMLIQPYLENAILHGINPKDGNGHILIYIKVVNQFIKISVRDDGIGRDKSRAIHSLQPAARHKSLGMKITKDRVRILNNLHQSNLNVNIIDLYNDKKEPIGTQVDLFIPYVR